MTFWDKTKEIRKNIVEICEDILYLIIFLFIVGAIFLAALTIIDEFKIREYSKKCSNEVSATKGEEVNTIKVLDTWKDIKIKMKDYNFKDYKFKGETANLIFICNTENDGSINVQYMPKKLESSTISTGDIISTTGTDNLETGNQQNEFAMKEKCAKYKDKFIQSIKDEYRIRNDIYDEKGFHLNDSATFVFYSPVRNSCVGAYDVYSYSKTESDWSIYYKIIDLLTNEVILSTHQIERGTTVQNQSYRNTYLNMVYDLQGYPECYCRQMDICRGKGGDGCE